MDDNFQYDVFLSHSSKDKEVVRPIATRLRDDGIKVWFDEWEIRPGDSIPEKIEEGLERSRVLVLCMSANAFGSDWAVLESGTFRFRDPLNKGRRFLPLRLDDAPIKGSLAQSLYIKWLPVGHEQEYGKLLEACRPLIKRSIVKEPAVKVSGTGSIVKPKGRTNERFAASPDEAACRCLRVLKEHKGGVLALALSPHTGVFASGSRDNSIKIWSIADGTCIRTLRGHTKAIREVVIGSNQRLYSACEDGTIGVWNMATGESIAILRGHSAAVYSIALTPDEKFLVSGSKDATMRVWELSTLESERVMNYGRAWVNAIVFLPDGEEMIIGTEDGFITMWNLREARQTSVLDEHSLWVWGLAVTPDGSTLVSGSGDTTVGLWDLKRRRRSGFLEGHRDKVSKVAVTKDGRWAISGALDNTARIWNLKTGEFAVSLMGHVDSVESVAISPDGYIAITGANDGEIAIWSFAANDESIASSSAATRYTNAKVLLVGESGAGKTGLSKRLALNDWQPSDSTVGAWATQWKLPVAGGKGVEREIWLWDFGGQADQRLIHQLYMDETALAVLVFDGQKDDLFETLSQWDRDLTRASRNEFAKLLVAGRVDAGGLRVDRREVEKFAVEHKFQGFLETSAKRNLGCEELKQAILEAINWDELPCRTTEVLFKRLKDEIIALKDESRALIRLNELREVLQLRLSGELARFDDAELRAVLTLLAGPGVVWELAFGSWVLLQPERINAYAQAVIRTLQADEHQRGCLMEERVLKGDLMYESSMGRLQGDEERFVLLAMHQTLVERGLCLRQPTAKGNLLIFPSYYRKERPDMVRYPAVQVDYRFTGFLDEIYATLVVRLHHSDAFAQDELWRYAADFRTNAGKQLGIKLTRRAPGVGDLEVYFDTAVSMEEKIIFSKYVHEHLLQHARDVERLRHYVCPECGTPVGNREVAMKRLADWLRGRLPQLEATGFAKFLKKKEETPSIICVVCEQRVPLWDEMEQQFASPEIQQRVRDMQEESAIELSNQSKERALVGEVISTVALADQISREFNVSDQGIDMEIELMNDVGEATGKKLYLQLKSGNSYTRKHESDGTETFTIKDDRRARYWMAQAFPVFLVIQMQDGEVRWMEVRDLLKRESENGKRHVKALLFKGERFDVMSVRRWRETLLQDTQEDLFKRAISTTEPSIRCDALRRVAEVAPDDKTRDFLLNLLQKDDSTDVRAAAAEELAQRWWTNLAVRQAVRDRATAEREGESRNRFIHIIEGTKPQLAGFWEKRLSGELSETSAPERLRGYPAIRVTSFQLRNIGPFQDTGVVHLQRDINVFLGDNAAGKTTILKCLALAAIGLPAANEVEDKPSTYLRKKAPQGSIEVLFELIPDPGALPVEFGHFASGLEIKAGLQRFSPVKNLTLQRQIPGAGWLSNAVEQLGALRSGSSSQMGFVCSYGAVRTFASPRQIRTELEKQENEWVLSIFKPDAWLVNPEVLTTLIRGDASSFEKLAPNDIPPEVVTQLKNSLRYLLPSIQTIHDVGDPDIELNQTPLRFEELSDGYRSLLALVGHLLRCSLKLLEWAADPTQIHGIILLDEIDIHLHPAWQTHVVQDFRKAFPNLQMIASTHSPLAVAALKKDNVIVMRQEGDGAVVSNRPEIDLQGLGVSGILTSVFDLSSTIDQPTLDKINRRLLLHSCRAHSSDQEKQEYDKLTNELASLGFNREFSDPYFERFAVAMAERHKAVMRRLTPSEKRELDDYANRLLDDLNKGGSE